jgi:DNA mismatch repair protein MutL
LPYLSKLGFDITEFGQNTFKVDAVPSVLTDMDPGLFIDSVLSESPDGKARRAPDFLRDSLMQRACKAAVKGGERLSDSEIASLLKRVLEEKMTLLCPHGRPVAVRIKKETVERWFKRII